MARRRDYHQRFVDLEAVPQHPVDDILRRMEQADRLSSLEQVERGWCTPAVGGFLFPLHPAAPPDGRPVEGGMLESETRQCLERVERIREQIVVQADLGAVRTGRELEHA